MAERREVAGHTGQPPTRRAVPAWAWPPLLLAGLLAAVLALSLAAATAAFAGLLGEDAAVVPATVRATGGDGLWLGHAWVDGRRTPADLGRLAARLRASRIRDVFVHVGPLADDGTLSPARHPRARWLITGLHEQAPGVRVQAWLGDLAGPDHLRLADPVTRARVLRAAAGLLATGFGGIHYDLEPVPSGDPSYLALLAATHRLTRARHAVLSVACDQLEPLPYLHTLQQWLVPRPHWWSTGYLHAVATRTDQVALMTYGTGAPDAAAYSGYIRVETRLALAAVPPRVSLLIGLPAYHTLDLGHFSGETVAAAIRGVRLALGARPAGRPVGVALYVDFTATPADWAAYRAGWVRPHPGAATAASAS